MNLSHLEIFVRVVDCGSFTKAADSLYISHATTSRAVSSLEESLGVKLLQRDNRAVNMTPAGQLLYTEGKKILKQTNELEKTVKEIG